MTVINMDLFKNIKKCDIFLLDIPSVKKRSLNPLCNNKRLINSKI